MIFIFERSDPDGALGTLPSTTRGEGKTAIEVILIS